MNGRSAISETWRLLGDYDKMLATYDEIDRVAGDDTLGTNYIRQLRGRAEAATLKVKSEELKVKSGVQTTDEIVDLDALSTDELSQYIRTVIIRERLYLNTQFDRQAAIDYFHLSKERIGAAFSQGSEFPTIADFINHCRLEYAKELLAVNPEMTVDDIASVSGFGTRRTFSRLFKERYSITPTEYRNQNV